MNVFSALLKLGNLKEAECQRDRVIETFKEGLTQVIDEMIGGVEDNTNKDDEGYEVTEGLLLKGDILEELKEYKKKWNK